MNYDIANQSLVQTLPEAMHMKEFQVSLYANIHSLKYDQSEDTIKRDVKNAHIECYIRVYVTV